MHADKRAAGNGSIIVRIAFDEAANPEEIAMNISEVMTRDVQIASPDDVLQKAAQLMEKNDFGILPIGENDRLVGMLSDRDITIRAVARGLAPDQCKVREVMSQDVRYVYEDESVEDVARNMSELQVRRLPVVNRDKRLVGIVSLCDLAIWRSGDQRSRAGRRRADLHIAARPLMTRSPGARHKQTFIVLASRFHVG